MRRVTAKWRLAATRAMKTGAPLLIATLALGMMIISGLSLPHQAEASGVITSCADCHGNPPVDNATRDGATGQFPGSHNTHTGAGAGQYGFNCEICHVNPNWTSYSHQNGNIQVNLRWLSMSGITGGTKQNGSVSGWGSYSKGTSFAVQNISTWGGACNNTYCHSNGAAGTWNTPGGDPRTIGPNVSSRWGSNSPGCTPCHGNETGNPGNGAPWYTSAWQRGWTTHKANSHQAHAGSGTPCWKCHYATTNTGNTITSVGNHIKRTYTVTPAPGINYTYAYMTNGGTCSAISCHGGGNMKWGTGVADCVSCHSAATSKSLSFGTIRKVVGTDNTADFNMSTIGNGIGSRHLFGATTIVKWDCMVCHREGDITTGKASASYHNDGIATTGGLIHLRNVDTTDQAQGWTIDNKRWTTNDYTNMDLFCVSCHDADGASQIAVNNTNNGLYTGVAAWNSIRTGTIKAALAPFNSTDTSVGYIRGATTAANAGPRMKVINVKDQFYAGTVQPLTGANGASYNGNPSQHGVLGQRYGTTSSWVTAAWVNYTSKKTGRSLQQTRETSLLSCADCHVLDSGKGAHGGTSFYNMGTTNVSTGFCVKCHASGVYVGVSNAASRFAHNTDSGNIGSSSTAYGLAAGNYQCMMCHASWNNIDTVSRNASYGGIHGSWSSTAAYVSFTTTTAYRFNPGGWRASNQPDWTTARATCYFRAGAADAFSSCTSHSSATGRGVTTAANYVRPVKY